MRDNIEDFLCSLRKYGAQRDIPNISRANAKYLRSLIRENNSQHLLEIGSANGYSTIQFAREIEKTGGKITSIEFSQVAYEEAQENFENAQCDHLIEYYFGDAREIIPLLQGSYDFVFIDGLKKASLDFLKIVWDKVPSGGIIVVDDVIKFRHKMLGFFEYLEEHAITHEVLQIDDDDGICVIKK